jgi:hypothetical protein
VQHTKHSLGQHIGLCQETKHFTTMVLIWQFALAPLLNSSNCQTVNLSPKSRNLLVGGPPPLTQAAGQSGGPSPLTGRLLQEADHPSVVQQREIVRTQIIMLLSKDSFLALAAADSTGKVNACPMSYSTAVLLTG